MRTKVMGRHMTVSPRIREFATQKLSDALTRVINPHPLSVDIELMALPAHQDEAFQCKVRVEMPKGRPITISESGEDLMACINLAHDRLLYQVKRAMNRRKDRTRAQRIASNRKFRSARRVMTVQPEVWERELAQFEAAS